ncbi:MAG: hypothetical protein WCF30_05315 [Terracidiphilus sp.]
MLTWMGYAAGRGTVPRARVRRVTSHAGMKAWPRLAFTGYDSFESLPGPLNFMRSSLVRNWLIAFFLALPCALSAQVTQVPFDQCVYRLGDNSAWSAANVDPSGWRPYTEYRETGDAYLMWVRCRVTAPASHSG